jgi:hypothetical protein
MGLLMNYPEGEADFLTIDFFMNFYADKDH